MEAPAYPGLPGLDRGRRRFGSPGWVADYRRNTANQIRLADLVRASIGQEGVAIGNPSEVAAASNRSS